MSEAAQEQTGVAGPAGPSASEWGKPVDKEGAVIAIVFGVIGGIAGVGLFVAGQIIPGIIVFIIGFIILGLPLKAKREREEKERQVLLREQVELLRRLAAAAEQKSSPPPADPGH